MEKKAVLIVEDDPETRRLVRAVLREVGDLRVAVAQDGLTAVHRARRMRPDLVVLDVKLPRLDGFAVADWLRDDPLTSGVPILVLTAASRDIAELLVADGCQDYLLKPFDVRLFADKVRRLLDAGADARPAV